MATQEQSLFDKAQDALNRYGERTDPDYPDRLVASGNDNVYHSGGVRISTTDAPDQIHFIVFRGGATHSRLLYRDQPQGLGELEYTTRFLVEESFKDIVQSGEMRQSRNNPPTT